MTKKEQKRFVRELTNAIGDHICERIDTGTVPEDWDGHELREYIYQQASGSRSHIMQMRGNHRAREYQNTRLVSNL